MAFPVPFSLEQPVPFLVVPASNIKGLALKVNPFSYCYQIIHIAIPIIQNQRWAIQC
jgi:hypothetical protein